MFIIIIIIILILGIISVVLEIRNIDSQYDRVFEYSSHLRELIKKANKKQNYNFEKIRVIALSSDVIHIFDDGYSYYVYHLSSDLSQDNVRGVLNQVDFIGKAEIETYYRLNKEKNKLRSTFINPFTLFYRGIGFILRYVFGYFIELFDKEFDYNGKLWKTINLIITLLASIITILGFFGFNYTKLSSLYPFNP